MKNLKKNKKSIILIIIIITIIVICRFLFNSYYKVEDRIASKKSFEFVDGEKATGWLRVQGTNIDMAILNNDDQPNLNDPRKNIGWTNEKSNSNYDRMIIYSHNMLNVSKHPLITDESHQRFEQLMSFIYYDFAKNNLYMQYTVDNENNLYKIYAVYLIKDDLFIENEGKLSKKEKKEYINNAKKYSYFKYNVDVDETDKLITLSTCTRFYGNKDYSFVVDGRKTRKGELITKYKIREKNNYKKIKKVLKGDE